MEFTDKNGVQVAESAVELSKEQNMALILQNYRKEPVELISLEMLSRCT